MHMKLLFVTLTAAALAGCAGEAELRSVSGQSAKMLTSYNKSLRAFAAGQSALAAATEARIQRFEAMRRDRQSEVGARVDTWKYLDDKPALHRFEVVGAASADDLIAAATPQLPPEGLPALKFEDAEVGQVIKQLVELQKPVTIQERVEDLIAFGTAVRSEYNGDVDEASGETAAAAEVAAAGEASVATTAARPKP
jgi:hypothetical protein